MPAHPDLSLARRGLSLLGSGLQLVCRARSLARPCLALCLPLALALSHAAAGGRARRQPAGPESRDSKRPAAGTTSSTPRDCEQAAREAAAEAERARRGPGREPLLRAAAGLEAARRCSQRARDAATEADVLARLGEVAAALGEWERARSSYEAAAKLRRALGDRAGEAEASCGLSQAYTYLFRPDEAVESAQSALEAAQSLSDARLEARARSALGYAYYFKGDPHEARRQLERAVELAPPDDARTRAASLFALGHTYGDAGELERGFARFQEALPLWEAVGDAGGQARTLTALGRALNFRGERQSALEHHRRALALAEAAGDQVAQAVAQNNLGHLYESLGQHESALESYELALKNSEAAGDRAGRAIALQYVGNIHAALGRGRLARAFYERGLAESRALGDRQLEAYALNNLGVLDEREGRAEVALGNFRRVFDTYERDGNRRGQAYALANAGFALEKLSRREEAFASYGRALALFESAGDREGELFARHNLARVLRDAGRLEEARAHCERSLELIERLRTKVSSQEQRTSYFASVHRHYELYVDVLMSRAGARPGRSAEFAALALQASERARARTLLETLAEVRAGIRQGVEPALAERQRALQLRIDESAYRQTRLLSGEHTGEQAEEAARELRALLEEYEELKGEIRARSPRYASLVEPQPVGLEEMRRLLDGDSLLVEYALGERRSFVWAVTRDGFTSRELPPRAEIERAARRLLELLTARQSLAGDFAERERLAADADARYWREAAALSEMILAPVASELAGRKRLLVVADGALNLLPFDALPAPRSLKSGDGSQGSESRAALDGRRAIQLAASASNQQAWASSQQPTDSELPTPDSELSTTDSELVPMMFDHEIVNLPSVSALAALRQDGPRRVRATGAVAVLADPVFERDDPRVSPNPPDESQRNDSQSNESQRNDSQSNENRPSESQHESQSDASRSGVTRSGVGSESVGAAGEDEGAGRRRRGPAAAFAGRGWARLPASRDEAEAIMSVVPEGAGLKIMGFDATRAAAESPELARYRVVHFATHGLFDEQRPELSCVVLSLVDERGAERDGYLRLHDIYNLNLPVELVVLSACETGRGRDVRGEGLVGLTRGFMYAGAGGVLASLWKVDDEATAELMRHFYSGLLRENLQPAEALRAARLRVWREARWRAPYYWAAFVLQGEYGGAAGGAADAAGRARAASAKKIAAGTLSLLALSAAAVYALRRRRRGSPAAPRVDRRV